MSSDAFASIKHLTISVCPFLDAYISAVIPSCKSNKWQLREKYYIMPILLSIYIVTNEFSNTLSNVNMDLTHTFFFLAWQLKFLYQLIGISHVIAIIAISANCIHINVGIYLDMFFLLNMPIS